MKKLEKSKSILRSKTIWLNALLVVLAVLDLVGDVTGNPRAVIIGIGLVNILLRLVTKEPIKLV